MAFGQAAGPPASAKQLAELAALLAEAGYDSFREARHPYGLTQRQANGKFTSGEAAELLERLEAAAEGAEAPEEETARPSAPRVSKSKPRALAPRLPTRPAEGADAVVTAFPDELLAEELVRRGWTCTPPP